MDAFWDLLMLVPNVHVTMAQGITALAARVLGLEEGQA
jgi:hypothetical protein